MRIRPKHYPHPVLTYFEEEIKDLKFSCELSLEEDVELDILRLRVNYSLENMELMELIQKKSAIFGLHLECPSTMKRILLTTNNKSDEFEVQLKDLNKTIDVNYFILANEKITDYKNETIDPYSIGLSFEVSKGEILAIAPPEVLEIEKDSLIDLDSIFQLIPSEKKNGKPIEIDLSREKIRISLPTADFEKMSQIHNLTLKKADSFLTAIYYTPAIAQALYTIREVHLSGVEESLDEIRDTAWYKSIKQRLFKLQFTIEDLPETDLFGIAAEVLDNPNKKSMDYLLKKLEEEGEE